MTHKFTSEKVAKKLRKMGYRGRLGGPITENVVRKEAAKLGLFFRDMSTEDLESLVKYLKKNLPRLSAPLSTDDRRYILYKLSEIETTIGLIKRALMEET